MQEAKENLSVLLSRSFPQGKADLTDRGGFSRVAAGFSSYDGDLSLPLGLALGSPIFPSGCEGKLGVALESLQGPVDILHMSLYFLWAPATG